jgi:hypothetical protein
VNLLRRPPQWTVRCLVAVIVSLAFAKWYLVVSTGKSIGPRLADGPLEYEAKRLLAAAGAMRGSPLEDVSLFLFTATVENTVFALSVFGALVALTGKSFTWLAFIGLIGKAVPAQVATVGVCGLPPVWLAGSIVSDAYSTLDHPEHRPWSMLWLGRLFVRVFLWPLAACSSCVTRGEGRLDVCSSDEVDEDIPPRDAHVSAAVRRLARFRPPSRHVCGWIECWSLCPSWYGPPHREALELVINRAGRPVSLVPSDVAAGFQGSTSICEHVKDKAAVEEAVGEAKPGSSTEQSQTVRLALWSMAVLVTLTVSSWPRLYNLVGLVWPLRPLEFVVITLITRASNASAIAALTNQPILESAGAVLVGFIAEALTSCLFWLIGWSDAVMKL